MLIFESMTMIDLDFLNSIKSSCLTTKAKYILLKINYFNRFVWAKSYEHCIMMSTMNLLNNFIASIFGWPRSAYIDNDTHFTDEKIQQLIKIHEIVHYTTSISHSSSIELIEKTVQLIINEIRKKCIQRKNPET